MLLNFNKVESEIFFDVIDSECKCIINEYDPGICRCPSRKRMENGEYVKSMILKWSEAQPKIENTDFVNLDNISECKIKLTKKEIVCAMELLNRTKEELRKILLGYKKHYTGIWQIYDEKAINSEKLYDKLNKYLIAM